MPQTAVVQHCLGHPLQVQYWSNSHSSADCVSLFLFQPASQLSNSGTRPHFHIFVSSFSGSSFSPSRDLSTFITYRDYIELKEAHEIRKHFKELLRKYSYTDLRLQGLSSSANPSPHQFLHRILANFQHGGFCLAHPGGPELITRYIPSFMSRLWHGLGPGNATLPHRNIYSPILLLLSFEILYCILNNREGE